MKSEKIYIFLLCLFKLRINQDPITLFCPPRPLVPHGKFREGSLLQMSNGRQALRLLAEGCIYTRRCFLRL